MVGSNYTQELRDRGLTTPGETRKVWDFNLGIGGPIAKDRVWYYLNLREEGSERTVPGMFANANAGDPTKWTYVADTSRPAVLAASYRITALRLTAQATPRNKFTVFYDQQLPCEGGAAPGFSGDACRKSSDDEVFAGSTAPPTPSASAIAAPETAGYRDFGNRVSQVKWTSPLNNRLLLEAGTGMYRSRYGGGQLPGLETENLIRVVEACAGGCAGNGNIPGLTYRSLNWFSNVNWNTQWNAAASLVTGSHSIKVGYQGALLIDQRKNFGNWEYLQYRVNNAIPDQITLNINRFDIRQSVRSDAFYAQEQWTLGRITLQGALRYDHAWSYFPEQQVGPVRFFPNAVTYPRTTGVEGYNDLWPRGGVAFDVFGTGKTSVKVNVGTVSRGGAEWRVVHRAQSDRAPVDDDDEGMDRREPQLRGRLQSDESGQSGPARDRRRSVRPECQRQFRDAGLRVDTGSGTSLGVGCPGRRLAVGRIGAARSASSRGGRGGIPASMAGQLHGGRQPHARRPRITRSSASTFPSIHGCRAAAAGCLVVSTTSRRSPRRG